MACDYVFKIIIVGEPGVGKSCLLSRFADQSFTENYINTIGVDFKVRTLDLFGKSVKLNIWDSAGQERFRTIVNTYYRGAHGICVVYDITDRESFEALPRWLRDVTDLAEPNAKKMLIGTKLDLESKRRVPVEAIKRYSATTGIDFVETSSKTGYNVDQAFIQMTEMLVEEAGGAEEMTAQGDVIRLGENTKAVNENKEHVEKKKCCK